jgi:hypothetical protein
VHNGLGRYSEVSAVGPQKKRRLQATNGMGFAESIRGPPLHLQTRSKAIWTTAVFATAWIGAVSLGLAALLNYENAPGRTGASPSNWPADSKIQRARTSDTLVMLAHPRCPCTRASMGELAQIMERVQGKVRAYVLFLKPHDSGTDWDDTDLRRKAAAIPGVAVLSDVDGIEAHRFGAETSGHTFLFDSDGRLLFNGGITESRGHAGDNAGESAIVSLVSNRVATRKSTFVFGCGLMDRTHKEAKTPCPN